jgi:hypothetical protein
MSKGELAFWLQDYASQDLRYERNPDSEIAITI